MKKLLRAEISTIMFLCVVNAYSQFTSSYQWTWIGGDNVPNTYGVYGQKGIESTTNKPGARVWVSNWTDGAGNLWLFGGTGYAASTIGDLNDLWRYNVNTNSWTWMAGDSVVNTGDVNGSLGEEGYGFTPGAREGASAWVDANGTNLYLFGGWRPAIDQQPFGDIWSFSTISNKWRWVKSTMVDSNANCIGQAYGSAGEFTPGVWPGCRAGATAASAGGIAYLFGGGPYTLLNDLYRFADINHTPENQWAYLYFSSEYNYPGKYTGSNARPGGRRGALSFVAQEGLEYKYYVFGGLGYGYGNSGFQFGRFNDLWSYDGLDPITQEPVWTWEKGDSTVNGSGNYGTFGVTSSTNNPPAKGEGSLTPAGNGQFILFGGYNSAGYYTNDVWSYDANSNTWTWIGGNNFQNSYGNYGVKGVQQSFNMISARVGHASWITPNGDMYVFGGFFTGHNNDLWKFSAPVDLISIDAISANTVCAGDQFTVSYSIHPQASNPFTNNNFYVQLSDSTGSNYTTLIGSISSRISGTIISSVPSSIRAGSNYKIRVVSSSPFYASKSNGIVINNFPVVPAKPQIVLANKELTRGDGWTDYYYNDTLLVLSLKKNGNNIGTIGDGKFKVECTATQKAGTGSGVNITNPLVTNSSGYWTMNRYWNVVPTQEPSSPVGIRFYFNDADFYDIKGSVPSLSSFNQLQFYKTIGGNPDPESNWDGVKSVIPILNGSTPGNTSWVYANLACDKHSAEFTVSSFSGGGGGGTPNGLPLPVSLLSFSGTLKETIFKLKWETTTESNASIFSVQRSTNGTNFTEIGNVRASGNSTSIKSYVYLDQNPSTGNNFYRLKMIDADGKFTYSNIVSIKVNRISDAFKIFPNPAKGSVTITCKNSYEVKLFDASGRLQLNQKFTNRNALTLSVKNLTKGIYIVKLEDSKGHKETRKLILY